MLEGKHATAHLITCIMICVIGNYLPFNNIHISIVNRLFMPTDEVVLLLNNAKMYWSVLEDFKSHPLPVAMCVCIGLKLIFPHIFRT